MTVEKADRDPERTCNVEDCGAWRKGESVYCRHHAGLEESDGAPEGNTNAVSHGLYAKHNKFYSDVIDDELRALCDEIFQDYCTEFRQRVGELSTPHQARLFEIAVNHIKIIHSDNWLVEKPGELDSGHPLVDKETKYTDDGSRYHEYKESVLIGTQQKLRSKDRQWLKDYGLLNSPEDRHADAVGDLTELWASDLQD